MRGKCVQGVGVLPSLDSQRQTCIGAPICGEMNRIVQHVKHAGAKTWVRSHISTATAGARKPVAYIARKTKEEMMALHEEDAQRWNTTTLSTRFGAQAENVRALLKLHALRKQREKQIHSCEHEERQRIERVREKMLDAWSGLAEFAMRSRYVAHASRLVSSEDSEDKVKDNEGDSDNDDDDNVGEAVVADEGDEEIEEVVHSQWGAFLEKEVEGAAVDTPRKTTYAFVEIGSGDEGVRRAVWIREGASGRLRLADEAERVLLLNQVRAKDSAAFRAK